MLTIHSALKGRLQLSLRHADGPSSTESWLCWRCAKDQPGGLQRNWISPKMAARPDGIAYIAAHAHSIDFRRATVVSHHSTYITVTWDDSEATPASEKREPEVIPRESTNVWHGTIEDAAWEPLSPDRPDIRVPKSRRYCPETYAEIAAKHGVDPPKLNHTPPIPQVRFGGRPRQCMVPPAAATATKDHPAASQSSEPRHDACTPPSTAANVSAEATAADNRPPGPAAATAGAATPAENGFTNHDRDAETWLDAVRRYGNHVEDPVLQQMPRYLGLRRDLFVQSYALWLVVMVRRLILFLIIQPQHAPSFIRMSRASPLQLLAAAPGSPHTALHQQHLPCKPATVHVIDTKHQLWDCNAFPQSCLSQDVGRTGCHLSSSPHFASPPILQCTSGV